MIIRIMGEGQYELSDDELEALNVLDAEVESAVLAGDADAFGSAFAQLLDRVRSHGAAVADDVLVDSDLVLPPGDADLDEVADMLGDSGLIPG
ncbi:hypothetical protein BH20ACT6_BH20ACT6_17380 [soil metagenome]